MEEFLDIFIPSIPEELVATLEENHVAIQNYLSIEIFSFFKDSLTRKLKHVF
jgi:hypothetical protein